MTIVERALAGAILAGIIAVAALRARVLSPSGAAGALVSGTLAAAAGWPWAGALVAFFASSTLLSRWRSGVKDAATRAVVAKGGRRDAWQVAANGGIFSIAAGGALLAPGPWWELVALGALAAATADTWATEVGTAIGGEPRTLLGGQRVPRGTSGAVTVAGSVAMGAGALFLGTVAVAAGFPTGTAIPVVAGGVAGALADTLAGGTLQERRWCGRCAAGTERRVHHCGAGTTHAGGVAGVSNDVVNLTSSAVGALVALSWWRIFA
ncbi:MAG TPA: DUF92 domain-containing protein [Gemmatimonadales bacterium]|nr:DUF92 domain-containing protein [Gemmatimonadales bacterium]